MFIEYTEINLERKNRSIYTHTHTHTCAYMHTQTARIFLFYVLFYAIFYS